MSTEQSGRQRLGAEAARGVYQRTSRRGLLAKASAVLLGLGVGSVADASSAAADAPACCTGRNCKAGGGSCPGVGVCPSGWTYTGYTWSCCTGNKTIMCSDCRSNSTGQVCACSYRTNQSCTTARTATEISADVARSRYRPT